MKKLTILVFAFVLSSCGFEIVDTGHRGVEVNLGKVVGTPLPEGLYFYNPFTTTIVELNVQEQKLEGTTEAYTKDIQQVKVHYAINFKPDPATIHELYRDVGRDWQEKLLPQIITGQLKNAIGKWDAVNLVDKRPDAVRDTLAAIKEAAAARKIDVTRFEMPNLEFTHEFEVATEEKVAAQQKAAKAANDTIRILEEKKQVIAAAEGQAESMRIRAQALQQNKGLIEYDAVQKWNGVLPQYMMSGASVPFINLNK